MQNFGCNAPPVGYFMYQTKTFVSTSYSIDDVRVKIGEPIKIDARISGEPIPDTVWVKSKMTLKSTVACSVVHEDYRAKLLFSAAKRADTGTYLLKASNKNGTDEAEIDVLVVGPPSVPQGPLMAEDVFADRCNIKYR